MKRDPSGFHPLPFVYIPLMNPRTSLLVLRFLPLTTSVNSTRVSSNTREQNARRVRVWPKTGWDLKPVTRREDKDRKLVSRRHCHQRSPVNPWSSPSIEQTSPDNADLSIQERMDRGDDSERPSHSQHAQNQKNTGRFSYSGGKVLCFTRTILRRFFVFCASSRLHFRGK